jgi:glutamate/tyrosine decarboxylase-like PLP-dependent enzyme
MTTTSHDTPTLPEAGLSPDAIRAALREARVGDADWRDGHQAGPGGPVYFAGEELLELSKEAYTDFYLDNALYREVFPSATRFEREIIGMVSKLFHNDEAVGNVTSGGTESILLAVKAARDRARAERPEVTAPEIVAPQTAHPAFSKAAHLFGLTMKRTPLTPDYRVDLDAYRAAISPNTVLMVGSAPDYPYGTLDPIPEMAALAAEGDINFHTDACVGGFFLPFLEQLGEELRSWDFRVPGVTSISADLHKFGFAPRGNSSITWRDEEHYRYQPFEFDDWPSGSYRTGHLGGSRGSGGIAATWATLNFLGATGYRDAVERAMGVIRRVADGVRSIADFEIVGKPVMAIFSYTSPTLDMYAVAEGMKQRGWRSSMGKTPPSIHIMIFNALATPWIDDYLRDLREVADLVRAGKIQAPEREARYA